MFMKTHKLIWRLTRAYSSVRMDYSLMLRCSRNSSVVMCNDTSVDLLRYYWKPLWGRESGGGGKKFTQSTEFFPPDRGGCRCRMRGVYMVVVESI